MTEKNIIAKKKASGSDLIEIIENVIPNVSNAITGLPETKKFITAKNRFLGNVGNVLASHSPKSNTLLWGHDVINMCYEVIHGYTWMKAWGDCYKKKFPSGTLPIHTSRQVSFYTSSTITLIDSLRDKIALMVWAYFASFNPENPQEILTFEPIFDRLKNPAKYGLDLKNSRPFLRSLERIDGGAFKQLERFRNFKIHRMEPDIHIYGAGKHNKVSILIPLTNEDLKNRWEKKLAENNPRNPERIKAIKKAYNFNGTPYGEFEIEGKYWHYGKLERHTYNCLKLILGCAAECLGIISKRSPYRKS